MSDWPQVNYIRQQLAKGVSKDTIEKALIAEGSTPADIADAFTGNDNINRRGKVLIVIFLLLPIGVLIQMYQAGLLWLGVFSAGEIFLLYIPLRALRDGEIYLTGNFPYKQKRYTRKDNPGMYWFGVLLHILACIVMGYVVYLLATHVGEITRMFSLHK